MKVIDVYEGYFASEGVFSGVARRGAKVTLTATSDAGEVFYEVGVSFFPHTDDGDFAVSYDAYFSKEIYRAKGRRSKKREEEFLLTFRETADGLARARKARIFWDKPLTGARRG